MKTILVGMRGMDGSTELMFMGLGRISRGIIGIFGSTDYLLVHYGVNFFKSRKGIAGKLQKGISRDFRLWEKVRNSFLARPDPFFPICLERESSFRTNFHFHFRSFVPHFAVIHRLERYSKTRKGKFFLGLEGIYVLPWGGHIDAREDHRLATRLANLLKKTANHVKELFHRVQKTPRGIGEDGQKSKTLRLLCDGRITFSRREVPFHFGKLR